MKAHSVSHLLTLLEQHGIADEEQRKQLADEASNAPWMACLQTLAAWVATLFVASAVAGLTGLTKLGSHVMGIVLIGAALWLFWTQRSSLFAKQLALGLSLAGQPLLLYERFAEGSPSLMQGAVVAALLAAWPHTSGLHRVVCMVLAFWFACYRSLVLSNPGLLIVLLMTLAAALWLTRRHWSLWPRAAYMVALAHAATFLALALLLWRNSQTLSLVRFMAPDVLRDSSYLAYAGGAALLWLACAVWLTRSLVFMQRLWLLGAALVLAVIGFKATPSLLLCLTLALVTFHACQRAWCALAMLCACVLLGLFYYSLHQTLLFKSLSLAAAGCVLMVFGWQVRRWKLGKTPA